MAQSTEPTRDERRAKYDQVDDDLYDLTQRMKQRGWDVSKTGRNSGVVATFSPRGDVLRYSGYVTFRVKYDPKEDIENAELEVESPDGQYEVTDDIDDIIDDLNARFSGKKPLYDGEREHREREIKEALAAYEPSEDELAEADELASKKGASGTVVVKPQLCGKYCYGCPHGPYAWAVSDGSWTCLGSVGSH